MDEMLKVEEALRLNRLRCAVEEGIEALDRGDYTEIGDEELDRYLDRLTAAPRR